MKKIRHIAGGLILAGAPVLGSAGVAGAQEPAPPVLPPEQNPLCEAQDPIPFGDVVEVFVVICPMGGGAPDATTLPATPDMNLPDAPALPDAGLPAAPAVPDVSVPSAPAVPDAGLPAAPAVPGAALPSAPAVPAAGLPAAPAVPDVSLPASPTLPAVPLAGQ
jgi:hypothetical protein